MGGTEATLKKKTQRRKRSCYREREQRFERGRQSYKMLSPAYFVLQADKNSIIRKFSFFYLMLTRMFYVSIAAGSRKSRKPLKLNLRKF